MAKIDQAKLSNVLTNKYSVKDETFSHEVKDNPKDRVTVEVGDVKQPDEFYPQVKINRWGTSEDTNEVNFSIRLKEDDYSGATVETIGEVIKWSKGEREVHFYDKPELDEGGYEFEVILKEKPVSNVLEFTVQTKELNFFYQPPLTQQEIDEGAERPENVVGSYAVYHKTKGVMNDESGMEYKVGKALHIYRPKVTDANGDSVWGKLNIDEQNGLLTVTIDQTWLDNAIYPVIVDPTFGYSDVGGTTQSTAANDGVVYNVSIPENGTTIRLTIRIAAETDDNIKGLIYVDSGSDVGARQSVGDAVLANTANTWYNSAVSTSLTTGSWYLGVVCETNTTTVPYDTGVTNVAKLHTSLGYADPTNPWPTETDTNHTNRQYSIFVTYTKTGLGTPLVQSRFIVQQGATGTTLSVPFTSSLTGGNLAVVGITHVTSAVATVTDNLSNTYTKAVGIAAGTGAPFGISEIWYAKNITGGVGTVTVNIGGSNNLSVSINEFSGYDTTTPLDGTNAGTSASGTLVTPGAVTPSADNALFYSIGEDYNGSAQTVTANLGTLVDYHVGNGNNFERFYSQYFKQSTAAAGTASFTLPGTSKYTSAVSVFKAAVGGAEPTISNWKNLLGVGL